MSAVTTQRAATDALLNDWSILPALGEPQIYMDVAILAYNLFPATYRRQE